LPALKSLSTHTCTSTTVVATTSSPAGRSTSSGWSSTTRTKDDYTIREWVDAPGVQYVPIDGELKRLPGLQLVPAPCHTSGPQMVVIETGGRPVVVGGDVTGKK
jgi:glyoxylase-like metal-dependent hydrolase (beta-lactamase superfamily II)